LGFAGNNGVEKPGRPLTPLGGEMGGVFSAPRGGKRPTDPIVRDVQLQSIWRGCRRRYLYDRRLEKWHETM
jgi:hypothetical protein